MDPNQYEPLVGFSTGNPESVNLSPEDYERISEAFPAELRDELGDPGTALKSAMRAVVQAIANYQQVLKLPEESWKVGSVKVLKDELQSFGEETKHYAKARKLLSERARDCISSSFDQAGTEDLLESVRIAALFPDEPGTAVERARERLRDHFWDGSYLLEDIASTAFLAVDRVVQDPPGRTPVTQTARYLAYRLADVWSGATGDAPTFSNNPKPESYCELVKKVFAVLHVTENPQSVARFVLKNRPTAREAPSPE
jgi:hypothetical protein